MGTFNYTHILTNDNTGDAAQVMADLEDVRTFLNGAGTGTKFLNPTNLLTPYIHWQLPLVTQLSSVTYVAGSHDVAYVQFKDTTYLSDLTVYLGAVAAGGGDVLVQASADGVVWLELATLVMATGLTVATLAVTLSAGSRVRARFIVPAGGVTLSSPLTLVLRCRSLLTSVE